jgi:hypothetical protein
MGEKSARRSVAPGARPRKVGGPYAGPLVGGRPRCARGTINVGTYIERFNAAHLIDTTAFPRVSHSRQHSRGSKSRGVATLPRRGGVTEWIRCTRPGVTAVGMPDARKTTEMLRQQAERCRRLAGAVTDAEVSRRLLDLANEFDARAAAEEARSRCR